MVAGVVAIRFWWEPARRALVGWYVASLVPAVPAAVLVLVSPVFRDTPRHDALIALGDTVGVRVVVIALPFALLVIRWLITVRPAWLWWMAPFVFLVLLVLNRIVVPALDTAYAWGPARLGVLSREPRPPELGHTGRVLGLLAPPPRRLRHGLRHLRPQVPHGRALAPRPAGARPHWLHAYPGGGPARQARTQLQRVRHPAGLRAEMTDVPAVRRVG